MKFKVHTLDEDGLKQAATALAQKAETAFKPNIYIGIRTGGYDVARLMNSTNDIPILPITCRRPGTAKKNKSGFLKKILKNLPYFISNQLRILEHIYLTQIKKPKPKTGYQPDEKEYADLKAALGKAGSDAKILIIDDSLDSGATMQAVQTIITDEAHDEAVIKTGVITLTTENPLVHPDFKLYDLTLCRFPWSFDFKGIKNG